MIQQKIKFIGALLIAIALFPQDVFAMHVMEGFLPVFWSTFWFVCAIPFLWIGLAQISSRVKENPKLKILLAVAGAFTFVLSALKIPSVTGSCSHPTGIGFGTILFGPFVMSVMGSIVLIFQALLLAHGGITTLGANTISMAVVGSLVSYGIYKTLTLLKAPQWLAVFSCAFFGNLATYMMTSFQLALAFPSETGGYMASLTKFLSIFAITQIPLAITEGILTWLLLDVILKNNPQELRVLGLEKVKSNA